MRKIKKFIADNGPLLNTIDDANFEMNFYEYDCCEIVMTNNQVLSGHIIKLHDDHLILRYQANNMTILYDKIKNISSADVPLFTPELNRIKEIQQQSKICGEFLEWLQTKYAIFRKTEPKEEPFYRGNGDYINIEHVLSEFFDINMSEVEMERQLILNIFRHKNQN